MKKLITYNIRIRRQISAYTWSTKLSWLNCSEYTHCILLLNKMFTVIYNIRQIMPHTNKPCPEMRLNTLGSRTGGRCCETDDRPEASEAWSRDTWLVYEHRVEPRRLDISVIVSPLTAIPGTAGALSFGCSRVLFSIMILNSGRYSAEIRACDDCNATNTVHS